MTNKSKGYPHFKIVPEFEMENNDHALINGIVRVLPSQVSCGSLDLYSINLEI